MDIFVKKCITDKDIIKLLSSRRWEGMYLPHSFALALNICCCPPNLTWFKDLYGPKNALYKKRPDH